MICPCGRSRFHWLRRFCALICAVVGCCALPPTRAQSPDFDKPLQSIDEEITAFAFAPDGRIVYSVRHNLKTRLYDLQRDDIWLQETTGKRRRILLGEKFSRGNTPFSYTVNSFRWSPNGRLLLAQLFTTKVIDDSGKTEDSPMTLVLEDNGKEVRINGRDSLISGSTNAFWLLDNKTIVYLTEAVKPRALYSLQYTNIATGPAGPAFEGRTFLGLDTIPGTNAAIAVEQDSSLSGPPRLQHLDLLAQIDIELATLVSYEGGISVSPSGKKVAFFLDKEVLEVRDLTPPERVTRIRVGLGVFHWAPDESRILLKRAVEKKTADVVWIDLPPLFVPTPPDRSVSVTQPAPQPILHGLGFRDVAISPDGRFLGVIATGNRSLLIYPLADR
ncbi:MAG TPA: hypothetical protein VOA64_20430 [Candidatus Dormibacteraeota bacterium]|nr:hypothetical protein [Candidatus Dormibacteraeota bacterium]